MPLVSLFIRGVTVVVETIIHNGKPCLLAGMQAMSRVHSNLPSMFDNGIFTVVSLHQWSHDTEKCAFSGF